MGMSWTKWLIVYCLFEEKELGLRLISESHPKTIWIKSENGYIWRWEGEWKKETIEWNKKERI